MLFRSAVSPNSLLSRDEATLMAVVGAIEAIRTGSTTVVENVAGTKLKMAMPPPKDIELVSP